MPRPRVAPGQPIAAYSTAQLVALVRHVRSDGVLRTHDQEIAAMMTELGFSRRGSRVVATIAEAIATA